MVPAVDEHGDAEDAETHEGEPGADQGWCGVTVAGGDDEAADPRAEGVREVQGGVVAGRRERLRGAGHLHQPELEADDEDRGEHRRHGEDHQGGHGIRGGDGEERQGHPEPGDADDDRPDDRPVPQATGDEVARRSPPDRRRGGTVARRTPAGPSRR